MEREAPDYVMPTLGFNVLAMGKMFSSKSSDVSSLIQIKAPRLKPPKSKLNHCEPSVTKPRELMSLSDTVMGLLQNMFGALSNSGVLVTNPDLDDCVNEFKSSLASAGFISKPCLAAATGSEVTAP